MELFKPRILLEVPHRSHEKRPICCCSQLVEPAIKKAYSERWSVGSSQAFNERKINLMSPSTSCLIVKSPQSRMAFERFLVVVGGCRNTISFIHYIAKGPKLS